MLPHAKRNGYMIKDFLARESSRRKAFWTRLQCRRGNRYVKSSDTGNRHPAVRKGGKNVSLKNRVLNRLQVSSVSEWNDAAQQLC